MEVQFQNNSLLVSHLNKIFQLHPVWLRERLPGEEFFSNLRRINLPIIEKIKCTE